MHRSGSLVAQRYCRLPPFPPLSLGSVAAAKGEVQKKSRCLRKPGCRPALDFGLLQRPAMLRSGLSRCWFFPLFKGKKTKKTNKQKKPPQPNHKLWNLLIVDCMDLHVHSYSQLNVGNFTVSNVKKGREKSCTLSRKPWRLSFYPWSVCGSSLSRASATPSPPMGGGLPVPPVSVACVSSQVRAHEGTNTASWAGGVHWRSPQLGLEMLPARVVWL